MALTILFILATSVLQIVLADYNTETGKCFIEEYVSPY